MTKLFAKVNTLELMAKEYYIKGVPDDEIAEQDITHTVLDEIPYMLEGEVFSLSIVGKTKSSKSTLMLLLLWWILKKYFNKELELNDIASEQYEFGRKVINPEIHDTIIGCDEIGALEETGYNATIEQKYLEQFSDLQAQRNIHRITCSPRRVFDLNSSVIIKIISKDAAHFLTHCQIYYKIETPNYTHIQLVGRASFNVKPIMFEEDGWQQMKEEHPEHWKEYQKLMKSTHPEITEEYGKNNENGFFKYLLRETGMKEFGENGYGKYEKPIYARYRLRKFKKFSLLNDEGVMQMREMTFAELYLAIFEKIKPLIKIMRISKDLIEGKANVELKKRKIPATLFTMEILKTRVNSLVTQMNAIELMKLKLMKCKDETEQKTLHNAIKETTQALQDELNSLNRLVAINKEYTNI